jgi:DMSO/TMAO reductase YedYZ molybdopterin-dependent catalytic subunit
MIALNNEVKAKPLPPNQSPINRLLKWGEEHPGITRSIPKIDLQKWFLVVEGEVEEPLKLSWNEILSFPKTGSTSDFHCVEGWSVLNLRWEGILFKDFMQKVKTQKTAKFVTFECADRYTTSLSTEELSKDDVLLAYKLNGQPLEIGTGFPLRLVVPDKYGYKSALWLTKIIFTIEKEFGYWEKRGYSDTADVWKNDRFSK